MRRAGEVATSGAAVGKGAVRMRLAACPLVGVALALSIVLAGCGQKPEPATASSGPATVAAKTGGASPAKAAGTKSETMNAPAPDDGKEVPLSKEPAAAAPTTPPAFGWVAAPMLASIPAKGLEGTLQGKPFAPTKVVATLEGGRLKQIRFLATEDVNSAKAGDLIDAVFMVGAPPGAGDTWTKSLDADPGSSSAYYRYVDQSETIATVQAPWACALSLEGASGSLTAGAKAKGKALLCFGDDAKSFFGGEFEAEVRAGG
jgi:hypothetical protein